ncbi:protein YgfX [Jeongeupia naejangsanensis]|uniref:Toxin CptA n=1 Tax=Jeongeupia naejangsanensis TaxID=613195 RepID=A0ABS2BK67_9NEIS|nr:protein YgfX [Jeongeupia naejangsanensis]MBM3115478.1 hypothetical protein [Jeongeupia naejangsanensis]
MTPLPLRLVRSRQQRWLHAFALIGAVAAAIATPWPWSAAGLLWLCVAVLLLLRRRRHPVGLAACDDGSVSLYWPDGSSSAATLAASSRVGVWLIALGLKDGQGTTFLVLWPDSADAESLRQWRIWLRWTRPAILRRMLQAVDPR